MPATVGARPTTVSPWLLCLVAWIVPGGGHLWLGRRSKGLVFLLALPAMFATGLWLGGRLFPFEPSQLLVALSALAELSVGAAWMVARLAGLGAGQVAEASYEYGNAFLIVAGLLNVLVVLDAFDVLKGRK